jgi:hypothetical protein
MSEKKSNAGNGMGIAALILGIFGIISAFIPCFGLFAIFFGSLAIIFGAVGLSQAKKGGGAKGMPTAGLILGLLSTIFTILWTVVFAAAMSGSLDDIDDALNAWEEEVQEIQEDLEN